MRTAQYSFILVVQVLLLCAMFGLSSHYVGLTSREARMPDLAGATPPPAQQQPDSLIGFLSR
ncbi:MAG: hypothetical protein ACJ72E_01545 [Marmoricola sp.]